MPSEPVWDEAAIEAAAMAYREGAIARMGCNCRWDDEGTPPPNCRCNERERQREVEQTRAIIAAYFAALDRDALSIAGRLEAMAGLLSLPHGPAVLEVVVNDLLCAASRLRALGLIPEDKDRETGRRVREEVERRLGGRFSPQDRVAVESVAADIAAEARERGLIPTEGDDQRG